MAASYTVGQIRALVEAGIALTSEPSLEVILQKLVEIARSQVGSRYGALSVLSPDGRIERFFTSGIDASVRAQIGPIPEGHGLLGVLLREGESLLIPDISKDPRSCGFPPHHPPMKSLLGVPVLSGGRIIGNLYLKAAKISFSSTTPVSIMPLPTVFATCTPSPKAAMKLKNAAQHTACIGVRTRVETIVATELAASWKPLMKSNPRATATIRITTSSSVSIRPPPRR
jgi:transcriptional regulator with GAF, ATPase, and Fis domain